MTDPPPDLPDIPADASAGTGPAVPVEPVRLPGARHRWWAVPLGSLGVLVPLAVAASAALPARLVASKEVLDSADPAATVSEEAPYARVPASAEPVAGRLSFGPLEGVAERDEDHPGDVFFVTISEPAQSVLSHWAGEPEPEILPMTYTEKYGEQTPAQQRSVSLELMHSAEQAAQYVALRAVGIDAELIVGPAVVEDILCLEYDGATCVRRAPADDLLDTADRLTEVDGQAVPTLDDLSDALADRQPGEVIEVTFQRPTGENDFRTVTGEVQLIASPQDPERTIIGFLPLDTRSVRLPFELTIDTGTIGGPSAGLAFTLTLIDELSRGDLTGGADVAVTGTITLDGEVGAIGGLPQKASAVRQAGVGYFLVPAGQSEESLAQAREIAGDDVELIPVATLDEALAALEGLGGDPIEPVDGPADDSGG